MLNMVEVRTSSGTLLSLTLDDVTDGFIIEDIEGLDPVKATLVSSSFAALDGSQYQSSRRENRNIVLKIGLEPNWAVDNIRSLRHKLYEYLMPKSKISLRFYDSTGLVVEISGRVESFETSLFSKNPQIDVSVICFDPDFVELDPVEISGYTVSNTSETLISYDGTVEAGFEFVLNVDRVLNEFTIYMRSPDDVVKSLDFSASLIAGDVLTISTITGNKHVTLVRSGTTSSLLYGLSPQSNWHELFRGENYIRVYAEGAAIPFDLTYTTRHGGL